MADGLSMGVRSALLSGAVAAALVLDFKNAQYAAKGSAYVPLSSVPGYVYTRTGQASFVNSGGTVSDFAANVPPVLSGIGYEAYGALTNSLLQSQTFDNASWGKVGSTVTANATTAPDGTATADKVVASATTGNHNVFQSVTKTAAIEQWTASVFLKAGGWNYALLRLDDGGTNFVQGFVDLTTGLVVGTPTTSGFSLTVAIAPGIALSNGWYRFVVRVTTLAGINLRMFTYTTNNSASANVTGDAASGLNAWQAQLVKGDFADGGPIIATVAATASIGAPTLSFAVANGSYTAEYTYSDGTVQTIPTVVAGGVFTMPTYPATLTKPAVAQVRLK